MIFPYKRGSTSVIVRVFIPDNTSAVGAGLTGLTSASTNLTIAYIREMDAAGTSYTGANIEAVTTIGTYGAPSGSTKIKFKPVDATNFPGLYELQFHDSATAFGTGDTSRNIIINIYEVTTTVLKIGPNALRITLVPWDVTDGVRLGMTALPNAVPDAAGGLPVTGNRLTAIPTVALVTTVSAVTGLTAATVHSDLDDIQARLPAALTSGGNMKSGVQGFLDSVFTEGAAGRITAAVKQFFNIATPAATMDHGILVDTVTDVTGLTILTIADQVWEESIADHSTTIGSTAEALDTAAKPPSAVAIASAVWQDTTAGDFTTALSVGKSVMNGVTLGTGLTIAAVSGAVGSVTGAVGSVTGAVGSVTGAVGSVTGAVGSVTGLTAATVHADLDDIQARLPAALTAGGNIKADSLALSGDTVAADNAESFFDGTGYAGTNNVIPLVTVLTTYTGNTPQTGDVYPLASTEIADIKAKTDLIPAAPASTTNITAGVITTVTNVTTVNGLAANVITAASMAADASAEIADQVWDEAIAGHLGAGSTGLSLNSAGSAGDPWSTAVPGAYGAGTAGKILGDRLDVLVSSRSSHSAADVWAAATRTLSSYGTLVADVWASATRLLTAGTNIILAKGVGVTGFNDLSAAQVNTEADTALADYDAPTHTELTAELAAADDATLAAISALPTASVTADAVWNEAVADHLGAGSTGLALSNAESPGDPWGTEIPGAYNPGTAGAILGGNLDAKVSEISTGTGSGTGAFAETITVTALGQPVQNAQVRVNDGVNSWTSMSDINGLAHFSLDAGTYTVSITKAGYQFEPSKITVTG